MKKLRVLEIMLYRAVPKINEAFLERGVAVKIIEVNSNKRKRLK